MIERDKFNEWARFQTFDNMQVLTGAWIAWQARAEYAEKTEKELRSALADIIGEVEKMKTEGDQLMTELMKDFLRK